MKFTFYVDENGLIHAALIGEILLTQQIIDAETMDEALQIINGNGEN